MPRLYPLLLLAAATFASTAASAVSPCAQPQPLAGHPLSELPASVQGDLRHAVSLDLQHLVREPSMGLSSINPDAVSLSALPLAHLPNGHTLYAVSWTETSFGRDSFVWIVDHLPLHALVVSSAPPADGGGPLRGFAIALLPKGPGPGPRLLLASEDDRQNGNTHLQALCLQRHDPRFLSIPCPASCARNLNVH